MKKKNHIAIYAKIFGFLYAVVIVFTGLFYLKNLIFPPFSLKNEFNIITGLMIYCATFPANLILQIIFLSLIFWK